MHRQMDKMVLCFLATEIEVMFYEIVIFENRFWAEFWLNIQMS